MMCVALRLSVWRCGCTDALAFMHSRGVIHADLKLENLFLSDADTIKVLHPQPQTRKVVVSFFVTVPAFYFFFNISLCLTLFRLANMVSPGALPFRV